MACRISELVLGCRDPEVLARFWCEVLDFVVLDREEDGSLEIGPRDGFGGPQPTIILSHRDEPEQGKPRLHIDVNATDRDQDAELERLLKLGARPADIGQTGEEPWHVLADPAGNEFACSRPASTRSEGCSLKGPTRRQYATRRCRPWRRGRDRRPRPASIEMAPFR